MPSYKIIREYENGTCDVVLTADNGVSETQNYINTPEILTKAAQHFDKENMSPKKQVVDVDMEPVMVDSIVS